MGPNSGGGSFASAGERLYGTLGSWNSAKACGFIDVDDPPGTKFFAHKTEFAIDVGEWEPAIGSAVSFVQGFDRKSGKKRAQDIQFDDGSGGEPPRKQARAL